jgi:hypothetical protein
MRRISILELFIVMSIISCIVAPLPTLAYKIIRGFTRPFACLFIKGEAGSRAIVRKGDYKCVPGPGRGSKRPEFRGSG